MTISDATPIQFWLNGQETFNESPECGLTQVCFCQPFNCSDPIVIQINKEESDPTFFVQVTDSEDEELIFEEIESQFSFIPNEEGVCEKIKVKILQSLLDNPSFTGWTNENIGGADWSVTSGSLAVTIPPAGNSDVARRIISALSATGSYKMLIDVSLLNSNPVALTFWSNGVTQNVIGQPVISSSQIITLDWNESYANTLIDIYAESTLGNEVTINAITIIDVGAPAAFSDCIDLRQNHRCTKLISYTNSSDFDGITYEISPQPTFYLRVPAQLWKEDNPQTQEDLELSNGVIVTLRQTIQEKTLLELGYMPPYMHKKVQKILMHDTVIIDGIQWKKRDPYESESLKDYPLKTANVLLTKYNSVLKNTI